MSRSDFEPPAVSAARQVRRFYVQARRRLESLHTGVDSTWGRRRIVRYDGGQDPATGNVFKSVWLKVGAYCFDNQIDPAGLVRVAFDGASYDRVPYPAMLTSPNFVAAYRTAEAELVPALKLALRIQRDQLELGIARHSHHARPDVAAATLRSLYDESLGLSGLFRHCTAVALNDRRAAATYRDAAVLEYMFSRAAYDAAWGSFIPRAIREAAKSLLYT